MSAKVLFIARATARRDGPGGRTILRPRRFVAKQSGLDLDRSWKQCRCNGSFQMACARNPLELLGWPKRSFPALSPFIELVLAQHQSGPSRAIERATSPNSLSGKWLASSLRSSATHSAASAGSGPHASEGPYRCKNRSVIPPWPEYGLRLLLRGKTSMACELCAVFEKVGPGEMLIDGGMSRFPRYRTTDHQQSLRGVAPAVP